MNKHTCCICGKEFEGDGNNPYPVADEGVCCDDCVIYVLKEHYIHNNKKKESKHVSFGF